MTEPDPIVLITGGGRGIGLAAARLLAERGCHVLVGVRNTDRCTQTLREQPVDAGLLEPVRLDVDDPATASAAAADIGRRFGRLDVLVNNAGIAGDRQAQIVGQVEPATLAAVFRTNVFGIVAVTEAMLPLLRRSSRGRIVNVSSSVGSLTRMSDPDHYFAQIPGSVAYPASKSAVNQLTVQYAKALRADGILVNAADPGPCRTDFTAGIPGVTRSAEDGARVIVRLATLDDDGPTGTFTRDDGPVPW